MKTFIYFLSGVCLFWVMLIPNVLLAAPDPPKTLTASQAVEMERLTNRLEEIRSIDPSTLSRSEKKVLRREVRSIKYQMQAVSGGIYITAGTLLLILILILILA